METNVTIPEKSRDQEILEFRFAPGTFKIVNVVIKDPDKGRCGESVDITTQWANASTTIKDSVKTFFKGIAAVALDQLNEADGVDVVVGDITGEVFEDEV